MLVAACRVQAGLANVWERVGECLGEDLRCISPWPISFGNAFCGRGNLHRIIRVNLDKRYSDPLVRVKIWNQIGYGDFTYIYSYT